MLWCVGDTCRPAFQASPSVRGGWPPAHASPLTLGLSLESGGGREGPFPLGPPRLSHTLEGAILPDKRHSSVHTIPTHPVPALSSITNPATKAECPHFIHSNSFLPAFHLFKRARIFSLPFSSVHATPSRVKLILCLIVGIRLNVYVFFPGDFSCSQELLKYLTPFSILLKMLGSKHILFSGLEPEAG